MEFLFFVETLAMLLTLFASVIGIIAWALRELVKFVIEPSDTGTSRRRPVARPVDQWDPNHPLFSKRADR